MSCIFEDPEGKIIIMTKGADSIIYSLLSQTSKDSDEYKNS